MTNKTETIESSLFGTCEIVEIVKGKPWHKGGNEKAIIIAKSRKGYWVTWGRDTYLVTGNLCMDQTIEDARIRAMEYLSVGYGEVP